MEVDNTPLISKELHPKPSLIPTHPSFTFFPVTNVFILIFFFFCALGGVRFSKQPSPAGSLNFNLSIFYIYLFHSGLAGSRIWVSLGFSGAHTRRTRAQGEIYGSPKILPKIFTKWSSERECLTRPWLSGLWVAWGGNINRPFFPFPKKYYKPFILFFFLSPSHCSPFSGARFEPILEWKSK